MKTFTYAAVIALLTAGSAFAQSGPTNGSTMNNSTPTPSATGPADSAGTSSNQSTQPIAGQRQSGNMSQSSNMDQPSGKAARPASRAGTHRAARNGSSVDARENQETMRLNRAQLANNSSTMAPSGMSSTRGMSSSGAANPFNAGSPQQAQGGGPNCTPDNPSCGTARQNPAINSSPQHRTYGDQDQ